MILGWSFTIERGPGRKLSEVRRKLNLATVRVADDFDEFRAVGIFKNITLRSGFDRGSDLFIIVLDGEHENFRPGSQYGDELCGLNPVHFGHANIQQSDVRLDFPTLNHCFLAVGGLGNYFDVFGGLEAVF